MLRGLNPRNFFKARFTFPELKYFLAKNALSFSVSNLIHDVVGVVAVAVGVGAVGRVMIAVGHAPGVDPDHRGVLSDAVAIARAFWRRPRTCAVAVWRRRLVR